MNQNHTNILETQPTTDLFSVDEAKTNETEKLSQTHSDDAPLNSLNDQIHGDLLSLSNTFDDMNQNHTNILETQPTTDLFSVDEAKINETEKLSQTHSDDAPLNSFNNQIHDDDLLSLSNAFDNMNQNHHILETQQTTDLFSVDETKTNNDTDKLNQTHDSNSDSLEQMSQCIDTDLPSTQKIISPSKSLDEEQMNTKIDCSVDQIHEHPTSISNIDQSQIHEHLSLSSSFDDSQNHTNDPMNETNEALTTP